MASSKYEYDIKLGHYVLKPLNEKNVGLDTTAAEAADGDESTDKTADNTEETTAVEKVDIDNAPAVVARKSAMTSKLTIIDRDIQLKTTTVSNEDKKLSALMNDAKSTKAAVIAQQLKLLLANYDLETKKYERAKTFYDNTKLIVAEQQKVLADAAKSNTSESIIYDRSLPQKYQYLTESNIQNAKIHLNKIIKDDLQERIKGMVDFKKAFSKSDLLYGKDKDGYFAVCVDQADFNKLTNTLEEIGYLRDDILSATLPLIFDRSGLTK